MASAKYGAAFPPALDSPAPSMPIPEKVVAAVVKEASGRMSDPRYAQVLVGSWVQVQPQASRFITAYAKELGGGEGVVNVVFHAALIASCFLRHVGRRVRLLAFADLDAVAALDREAELQRRQPALFDYVIANVEQADAKRLLMLLALGMDAVT